MLGANVHVKVLSLCHRHFIHWLDMRKMTGVRSSHALPNVFNSSLYNVQGGFSFCPDRLAYDGLYRPRALLGHRIRRLLEPLNPAHGVKGRVARVDTRALWR